MRTLKKRVVACLLVLLVLLSMVPPELISAETVVIGGFGSIPSGGTTGTGGGIINLEHPTFVVGLSKETYSGDSALSDKADTEELIAKSKLQFKNHVPSSENSIFFAPGGSYTYYNNSAIAWYNLSSGSFNYKTGGGDADPTYKYKMRRIGSGSNAYLWYNQLYAAIPASGDKGALANGKWRDIVIKANKPEAEQNEKALALWSWILADDGKNIVTRLNNFLKESLDSEKLEDRNQQDCAWVDLMISLWQLSPPASKGAYEIEIERYLKDDNLIVSPPLISITTAVLIRAPKYNPQYLFIKSVDYVHFIARVVPEASLYIGDACSRQNCDYTVLGYKQMIKDAVDDSLAALKNAKRTTDLTGAAATNDAFNWGMSGVMSCRLSTASGTAVITNSSVKGALTTLNFEGGLYGFVVAVPYGYRPKRTPSGRFSLMTNPTGRVGLGATDERIGKKVDVCLELEQKGDKLTKWQQRLEGTFDSGFPKLQINLNRLGPSSRQADTTASETETNPSFKTDSKWKGNNTWVQLTAAELKDFVEGKTKIKYCDNTILYPIAEDSTVQFNYSATVKIKLSDAPEDLITLDPDPGEASVSFTRPKEPIIFRTIPSYWSEIKNGSPGNETFEAMAGVPTTRNLYFASGGSEFIVEIALEYVKDTEITRTYRSYFTAVDSEFKAGDTCPNKMLGGQSANMHGGGTYTRTWTGSIPNNASAVTAKHSASCPAQPDYTAYNAALAEANAFAAQVNATVLTHTSASDRLTRSKSGWNATVSPSPSPPGTTSASVGCTYRAPSGDPPSGGSPCSNEMATASPAPAGSYTITVTWTVPAHIICGPQCCRVLPQVEDTWTQKIKFDHMKIKMARVWKLDKAAVNGMTDITGTDEFKATVVAGDPNIFYNRSETNKSIDGRLRYSVEPDMHDTVVWNEGPRSSKDDGIISQRANVNPVAANGHENTWATGILYNNTGYTNEKDYHRNRGGVSTVRTNIADGKDVATMEWAKFNERRTTQNVATVISDMLILQTSSGDQSLIYFQKDSGSKQTQENFDKVAATEKEMFNDNPLSFADMDPRDINIGSYNGKYYTPLSKYSTYKSAPVVTKFDTVPAGLVRPSRPGTAMRLVKTNIDIIDTIPNMYYETGIASVFYKNILNYGSDTPYYSTSYNAHFGANGVEFISGYSDEHTKVNDIVVHDPVSTEFSMVIPLANSRDQRTPSTQLIGGNLQGPTVESVKRLKNPTPKQNLIWNGDAEYIDSQGKISNWHTWESVAGKAAFTKRTTSSWKISGSASFEIVTQPNGNYNAVYYTDVPGIPGDSYSFTGKLGAHRVRGYFYITARDNAGTTLGTYTSTAVNNNAAVQNLSINFTAPADTTTLRVHIVNGNTSGYVAGYDEYVFADDLVLYDNTTTTWQSMAYTINEYVNVPNPDYVTPYTIPNPDYIPPVNQPAENRTSGSWTAPSGAVIDVNVYATATGWWEHDGHGAYYASPAYGSGKVNVAAGDVISISGNSILKNGAMVICGNNGASGGHSASSCSNAASQAAANSATISQGTELYNYAASGSAQTYFRIPAITIPAVGSPTIQVNNAKYIPAVVGPAVDTTFNYTGAVQSFTAPRTGTYTLEVWGAQGGGSTGGKGGYSKGSVSLNAGDILRLYVGGSGDSGGWNGGGAGGAYAGGGGSDIRKGGTALSNRIIVAGGGGGADAHSYVGGEGGGATGGSADSQSGGSQTSGGYGSNGSGSLGQGGNAYRHGGGGGGGYYGGGGGHDCNQAGAGGSGYIGSVTGGTMTAGVRNDHGMIKITAPGISTPAQGIPWIEGLSPTIESIQPVTHTITKAPDSWYENVIVTVPAVQPVTIPGGGTYTPGNFINLDYGFQIYFPNRGDFFGDNSYGIASVTQMRGRGFVDSMDTTEWTKEKYVVFDFNVIHNGIGYGAGEDIPLDINDTDDIYDFYCPLANYEAISAEVTFKVIAINGVGVDNTYAANKARYNYVDARHSGIKKYNIDVVGRIGNLIMEDTGDFRFANLFKKPKSPVSWIIDNVVKDVDQNQQNRILGSSIDIRGMGISAGRHWLNTYGLLEFADRDPIPFPLTPDKNNIAALRRQPVRLGYKSYLDIQTIGNYSNGTMQIIPYYYWLDLNTREVKQVDIYMDINGEYKPINKFDAAVPGWDPNTVYDNITMLDWDDEFERRNYTAQEQARTAEVASAFQVYDTSGNLIDLPTPLGKFHAYGNSQILYPDGRNRTFIGTSLVNANDTNPGNVFSDLLFGRQGQRWHFTSGLPSSAVAVEHGAAVTQANIEALQSNTSVLLMALDIKSIGETYVLQYSGTGENSSVIIAGAAYNLASIPYPIVEVMSSGKSARDDLDTSGTH